MTTLRPADPVAALAGVGSRTARTLAEELGIVTVRDLLEHYPRRHADLGERVDLSDVTVGAVATLVGTVRSWREHRPPRRGRRRQVVVTTATVDTDGGSFDATWFGQPYRAKQYPPGTFAAFSGRIDRYRGRLQVTRPTVEVLGDGSGDADLDRPRLLPVYPATAALDSWRIARLVDQALAALPPLGDPLPEDLRREHGLMAYDDALRTYHHPPDAAAARRARERLVFDELLSLQLGLQWRRAVLEADVAGMDNEPTPDGRAARYLDALPFEPTGAQRRAFGEIGRDLRAERPMHRLLQGDVGAGKTVVAVWTMLGAADRGRQAALMAPTEVLAEQHLRTITDQLAPLGVNVLDGVRVELLTSSTPLRSRRRVLGELLEGRVDIVVGTHALLEEGVRFADLGVVVIDEQHRFGVSQRVGLRDKTADGVGPARLPDVLVMTATPIPRSLALTLYGDLDVTALDELPPGRKPVVTQLITPAERGRRDRLYEFVRAQARAGHPTFVVCPLVEDSDEVAATSVTSEVERLRSGPLRDLRVAMLHGRMTAEDKEAVMARVRRGEIDVLVATTVIEVGVDIPAATVMIVEDAERFGISQLHQLRGRVGRGGATSYCVLFAGWRGELTDEARERLEAVAATTDGFRLAEVDLELRGEGQLFGERQSGLPDLRLARLRRDTAVIRATRSLARRLVEEDPGLTSPRLAGLRAEVLRRYEGGLDAFAALATG